MATYQQQGRRGLSLRPAFTFACFACPPGEIKLSRRAVRRPDIQQTVLIPSICAGLVLKVLGIGHHVGMQFLDYT